MSVSVNVYDMAITISKSGFVMVSKLQHSTFCSNILSLFLTLIHCIFATVLPLLYTNSKWRKKTNIAISNMQYYYYFPWFCLCFLFGFQLFPFLISHFSFQYRVAVGVWLFQSLCDFCVNVVFMFNFSANQMTPNFKYEFVSVDAIV